MRRGLTLLEIMVALVTGGVVVLLAYATLQSGTDTEARLVRAREEETSLAHLRTLVGDGVRHALAGAGSMQVTRDAAGEATRLEFATRGVVPPLGAGGAWRLVLARDTAGLRMQATGGGAAGVPVTTHVRGARRFDVRFRAMGEDAWRGEWTDSLRLPQLVELRFRDADGRDLAAPLVARTAPVGGA